MNRIVQKISYGQNFEDVILARVFSEISAGNYIDVGANDPVIDSVTKYFYDIGWSGINIEPLIESYEMLMSDRPRDINLNICAGITESLVEFFLVKNRPGWSTSERKQIQKLQSINELETEMVFVKQKSLNSIIFEYKINPIHFLKIDVEGSELNVLKGLDLNLHRPWVILVEATEPGSEISTTDTWEHLLISNSYSFVYFDGLNRFYLADEHKLLAKKFNSPPNSFDNFIPWVAVDYYQQLMKEKAISSELNKEICKLYESTSWKVTKPFRFISNILKRVRLSNFFIGNK